MRQEKVLIDLRIACQKNALRRGHSLKWNSTNEVKSLGACRKCGALAIIVLRPKSMGDVVIGSAINQQCPFL